MFSDNLRICCSLSRLCQRFSPPHTSDHHKWWVVLGGECRGSDEDLSCRASGSSLPCCSPPTENTWPYILFSLSGFYGRLLSGAGVVSNPSMREQGSHLQPCTAMPKVNGTRSEWEKLHFAIRVFLLPWLVLRKKNWVLFLKPLFYLNYF